MRFKMGTTTYNKTDYGGQALFVGNTPRALERNIPIRTMNPYGGDMDADAQLVGRGIADREYVYNDRSTTYADIGKNPYGGLSGGTATGFYPNASIDEKAGGDKMTLAPMLSGEDLSV